MHLLDNVKQHLVLAIFLAGGTYGWPMLHHRHPSDTPGGFLRVNEYPDPHGLSPPTPMGLQFTVDQDSAAARIIRRSDASSDPFYLPEPEPAWKRRGWYNQWPREVSERRIKKKLGQNAADIWVEFELCMVEEIEARRGQFQHLDHLEPSFSQYLNLRYETSTMNKILEIEDYCVDETLAATPVMASAKDKRQAAAWRREKSSKAQKMAKNMDEFKRRQERQSERRRKQKLGEQVAREKKQKKREHLNNSSLPEDQSDQLDGTGDGSSDQVTAGDSQASQVNFGDGPSNRFNFGEAAGRMMNNIGKELNRQGLSPPGITAAPGFKGLFNGFGSPLPKAIP